MQLPSSPQRISGNYGEAAEAVWARLEKGGFTAEQVLGDWFPEASG
jgi:hypothetical protein